MDNQRKPLLNIPGTSLSWKNAQLLVGSGVSSLDDLIGGGYPIGSLVLLEEDTLGHYSSVLLKYFLAEGVVNQQHIFLASLDNKPLQLIQDLPAAIDKDDEEFESKTHPDSLKIAFRYEHLSSNEIKKEKTLSHFFDLSKKMPASQIKSEKTTVWSGAENNELDSDQFSNPDYDSLLKSINETLEKGQFLMTDQPKHRNVLRIAVQAIGSPLWFNDGNGSLDTKQSNDLIKFLYFLRVLLRQAFAVAFVTVPSYLLSQEVLNRCLHICDISFRLQVFSGTELEKNQYLSDYQGFFHFTKLAAINSLQSVHPGKVEYCFRQRRKKFQVVKLHLPPGIEEVSDDSTKKKPISVGCGSTDKHLLEF